MSDRVGLRRTLGRIVMNRHLYLMMIPGALFFLVYRYLPMYGVVVAFKDYRMARGILKSSWAGLKYFELFFASPFFTLIMGNTMVISLLKLVFSFPAPIVLALMLNEIRSAPYKRVTQTVLYLPHFLSWVVIGHLAVVFFAPVSGLLTNLIDALIGVRIDLMMDPRGFRPLLVLTEIWKTAGWGTIIYLAALAGVDPNLYEAAVMDGARKHQQLLYITIPSIVPVIVILMVLRVGQILHAGFEQIFVMQNPLVYRVSEILDTYVYRAAFQEGQYSLAAAVGLFQSAVGFILVVATNMLVKRLGEEAMW